LLIPVTVIVETSHTARSEKRQREEAKKESNRRLNDPNYVVDPLRLSVRNLPKEVTANTIRSEIKTKLGDALAHVKLAKDKERKVDGEAKSLGYAFLAFKTRELAQNALAWLNNNHEVFGKNRRLIVSFAVDDKRELHKQKKRKEWKEAADKKREAEAEKEKAKGKGKGAKGKGAGKGETAPKGKGKGKDDAKGKGKDDAKGKGKGKEEGKGKGADAKAPTKKAPADAAKTPGRGAKQRMKRRLEKESGTPSAKAEPSAKKQKIDARPPQRAAEKAALALPPGKRRKVAAPAPQPAGRSGKPKKAAGLAEDFEARMMNSWR
jgi:RNA recognition motif-containing protein